MYDNIPLSKQEPYNKILTYIGTGSENYISLHDLINRAGIENRTLRLCIEKLRRSGVVIVSGCNGGYYFPQNTDELLRYIHREEKRAKSLFYTLRAARQLYKTLGANNTVNNVDKSPAVIRR